MFERFSRNARAVVISTQDLCHELGAERVRPVHVLLALTEESSGVSDLLAAHGITTEAIATSLGLRPPTPSAHPEPTAPQAPLSEEDADALRSLGIDLDAIRAAVERQFGEGALDGQGEGGTQDPDPRLSRDDDEFDLWAARRRLGWREHVRFSRGAKKVLELSLREAIRTGAREIRSEHIALGVLRSDDETLRMVLRMRGVDERAVRADLENRSRRTA